MNKQKKSSSLTRPTDEGMSTQATPRSVTAPSQSDVEKNATVNQCYGAEGGIMGRSDYQAQQDHEDYDKKQQWVEPQLRQCKTSCDTHPTLPSNQVEQAPPSDTPPHQNIVRKQHHQDGGPPIQRQSSNDFVSHDGIQNASVNCSKGIREMQEAAIHVTVETQEEGSREDAPFDPNLICPTCMKQYRIGEVQLFKAHMGKCNGTVSW